MGLIDAPPQLRGAGVLHAVGRAPPRSVASRVVVRRRAGGLIGALVDTFIVFKSPRRISVAPAGWSSVATL